MVMLAQLVRALVCGAGGRRFESGTSPLKIKSNDMSIFFRISYGLIYLEYAQGM